MIEKILKTFLSIPVPDEVKTKKNMLYTTLENSEGSINWVKNINLHLTIKYLGDTPESSVETIIEHLGKIISAIKPFNLVIKDTGCFPIPDRPRVLWLGIDGSSDLLHSFVKKIETELEIIGFPKKETAYSPHITLARIKYPQKHTPDITPFLKSSYDPIDFPVDRVQFHSSKLLQSGAVYTILKTFPLGENL